MSQSDKRKQSLYFPESMLLEIQQEAMRLDRSLSWVMQRAWKLSRQDIRKLPSVNDVPDMEAEDRRPPRPRRGLSLRRSPPPHLPPSTTSTTRSDGPDVLRRRP
jgi:uncharacterized small protein (TIGR04563 family)